MRVPICTIDAWFLLVRSIRQVHSLRGQRMLCFTCACSHPWHSGAWPYLLASFEFIVDGARKSGKSLWLFESNESRTVRFCIPREAGLQFQLRVQALPSAPSSFCESLHHCLYICQALIRLNGIQEKLSDVMRRTARHPGIERGTVF